MMRLKRVLHSTFMQLLFACFIFCACSFAFFPTPTYSAASHIMIVNTTIDNNPQYFQVDSIDWSPNDETIALGTSLGIYLYSIGTESFEHIKLWSGTSNQVNWENSGDRLAGSERRLWIWNHSTGSFVFSSDTPDSYESFDNILWASDGQSIISNHYSMTKDEHQIVVWDLSANGLVPYSIPGLSNSVALDQSSNNMLLAIAASNVAGLQIIDLDSSSIVQSLAEARAPAAWSPDDRLLVTGSKNNALIVWDTSSWKPINMFSGPKSTIWYSLKWKPTGNYAAIATDTGISVWNLESGNSFTVQTEVAYDLDWRSDGSQLTTAIDNQLYIWNIDQLP